MRHDRTIRILLFLLCTLTVALAALTVAFLVTKYIPLDSSGAEESVTETEPDAPTSAVGEQDGVILSETPDAGISYQDSLTFVGDSLTAHLVSRGVLSGGTATTQVWRTESNMLNLKPGITAQTIIFPGPGVQAGTLMTVADAAALAKPKTLVITLGTDWGVAYFDKKEDFVSCYAEFIRGIQKASPSTTIVIQSIFPVTKNCPILSNAQIDRANGWIKSMAADLGCYYLDTQSVLKDENGCLKAEYCNSSDGIHLGVAGYEAILAYIRTHAVPN